MEFDIKKHAKKILTLEGIIVDAQMLAEGVRNGKAALADDAYITLAAGAVGVLSYVLDSCFGLVDEIGTDFVHANGLQFPLD